MGRNNTARITQGPIRKIQVVPVIPLERDTVESSRFLLVCDAMVRSEAMQ
jgi:hypothetical protein